MNWTKTGYISVLTTIAAASVGTWLYWRADNYVKPVDIAELMNGIIERQRVLITATSATVETNIVVSTNWQVQAGYTYQFLTTNGTYITSNYLELAVSTNVVVWTNVTDTMPVTPLECVVTATVTVGRYIDSITTNPAGDVYTNDAFACETEIRTNALTGYIVSADHIGLMQDAIRELPPHYAPGDTNPVLAIAWPVESMFASLGIGDGTNQFTAVPPIGTNAAVYGPPGAHIYTNTLIEMYRALYSLRKLKSSESVVYVTRERAGAGVQNQPDWATAIASAEAAWLSNPLGDWATNVTVIEYDTVGSSTNQPIQAAIRNSIEGYIIFPGDSNALGSVELWVKGEYTVADSGLTFEKNPLATLDSYGGLFTNDVYGNGYYVYVASGINAVTSPLIGYANSAPPWCPNVSDINPPYDGAGLGMFVKDAVGVYEASFTYCTNSL